ncbi:MAG TPA: serine/threonine-protein kinase [Gemmataceae bacterium]|jgi:serine/threonine-protein kinase|nr:serine/threonine-protein kinase [Gemmataceae bacterium]
MAFPGHKDALSDPADATINYRITPCGETVPTRSEPAAIPHCLGRFRVLGEIARGGMGVILRAYDVDLDREVAVKLLAPDIQPDSEAGQRFAQEARLCGQLHHPGIMPVFEAGVLTDGRGYFAMPLIQGRTLAAHLADRRHLRDGLPKWLDAFEQICQAMAFVHAKGIVHRDLKPANVMVGPFDQVLVMDWGVAAIRDRALATSDTAGYWVFGTPAYMSPEQARGSRATDPRADVFGLGAILCEILTGLPPYLGSDAAWVTRQAAAAHQDEAVRRLNESESEPAWVELALHCLAADPADRPADAGQVADLVRDLARSPVSVG